MNANRSHQIAVAFARQNLRSSSAGLCATCVEILDVTGVGMTVMGGDHAGPICVSDPSVAELEDLQYTIGQGPCRDAFHTGKSVHAPRLDGESWGRWPSFVDLARASDIGAVFAYPLRVGGASVGVMTIYQRAEGELTAEQHADSVELSDVLAETLLSLQAEAPTGTLAVGLDEAVQYRAEVYQASGMTSIQLSIPVAEAMLRIRAHAFANNQAVTEVAALIVNRELRIPDDQSERWE